MLVNVVMLLPFIVLTAGIQNVTITTNVFGSQNISSSSLWDGGLVLSFALVPSCSWNQNTVTSQWRSFLLQSLNESTTSAPYGWDAFKAIMIPTSAPSANASRLNVTLSPAQGFVIKSDIRVNFAPSAQLFASVCNCTVAPIFFTVAKSVTAFMSAVWNVTNEFDVQQQTIAVRVTLQYDVFARIDGIVIAIRCAGVGCTTTLNSGWQFTNTSTFEFVATHVAEPTFDLPFGQSAWFSVSVLPGSTFLNITNKGNVSIAAVDKNPLAFCTVSPVTVSCGQLRDASSHGRGVPVALTLSPPTADYFALFANTTRMTELWGNTILPSQLPDSVNSTLTTTNRTLATLLLQSTADFYLDRAWPVVFTPPPSILLSVTAGCGSVALSIVPSAGEITTVTDSGISTTIWLNESDIIRKANTLMLKIQFATFLTMTDNAFNFSSNMTTLGTTALREALLVGGNLSIVATTSMDQQTRQMTQVRLVIPQLSDYNIFGRSECIQLNFTASAASNNVAPVTITTPTLCIAPTLSDITIIFNSTGRNETNATTLWDAGDVMILNLTTAKWNTNLTSWKPGTPSLGSSSGALQTIGFLPINYSGVTFSQDRRVAYVPTVPLVGLSVGPNETGWIDGLGPLLDDPFSVNVSALYFGIVQAGADVVTFGCSGYCTTNQFNITQVNESNVRSSGFSFSVYSIYDVLVSQAELQAQAWSIFTRNASGLVGAPQATIRVSRINNYTATFTIDALPTYDITVRRDNVRGDDAAVLFLNGTMFMRNRFLQKDQVLRGFLGFRANTVEPQCTLKNFSTPLTESGVQTTSISFIVNVTLPLRNNSCSRLVRGEPIAYTLASGLSVNISVTAAAQCTPFVVPLTIQRNSAYEISENDLLTLMFNASFFEVAERCSADPTVVIPVIPAQALFYYTNAYGASFPFVSSAFRVGERSIRNGGLNVAVYVSGQRLSNCTFSLALATLTVDPVRGQSSNLSAVVSSVLMNASRCTPNVSTKANFSGTIPPLPRFDIGIPIAIRFVIPDGVTIGDQPITSNETLMITAESEDVTGYIFSGNGSNMSMRTVAPLDPSTYTGDISALPQVSPSLAVMAASIDEETIAVGNYSYEFVLFGDRWSSAASVLLLSSVTFWSSNGTQLQVGSTLGFRSSDLFAAATFLPPSNATGLQAALVVASSPTSAAFYTLDDVFVNFTVRSEYIDSGVVPYPNWFGFNITSGLPQLVAQGPALVGGTLKLLLGQLYVTIRIRNGVFLPTTMTPANVCPPPLDTCSIRIDTSNRVVNISFPSQDLVLYFTKYYTLSITAANIASNESIGNNVTLQIAVESGILSAVMIGQQVVTQGMTLDEALWRTGAVDSVSLYLKGDSFVSSQPSITSALTQSTTCTPPSDAYEFCTRLSYLMTGHVEFLDSGQKSVRLGIQADSLFDVYRPQLVTIQVGGYATTSSYSPLLQQNLSFVITPSQGSVTMTTTLVGSLRNPIAADVLQSGTSVIQWTFGLVGERWNVKETTPSVLTPSGQSLRQLILDDISSSSNAPFGFNERKQFLFANDVSVSIDRRTVVLRMNSDSGYSTPTTERISINFTSPMLFMSGLIPQRSAATQDDWVMVVQPTSVPLLVTDVTPPSPDSTITSSVDPSSLMPLTTVSTFVDVLQARGLNVTVSVPRDSGFGWDIARLVQSSPSLTSTSTIAAEPHGFNSFRLESFATHSSPSPPNLTLCIRRQAQYDISSAEGELLTWTINASTLTVNNTTPSTIIIRPSAVLIRVSVRLVVLTAVVSLPPAAQTCQSMDFAPFASNLSLHSGGTVTSTGRSFPLNLTDGTVIPSLCVVSVTVHGGVSKSAVAIRSEMLAVAPVSLRLCCSVSLVFDPKQTPSDADLRGALGLSPAPTVSGVSVMTQVTWVLVSLGILLLFVVVFYLHRKRMLGKAFSGSTRVAAEEPLDVIHMKMLVEDDNDDEKAREARLLELDRRKRIHEANGLPTFSPHRGGADGNRPTTPVDIHESLFAGQPAGSIRKHILAAGTGKVVNRVEPPAPDDTLDHIIISPSAIDGVVSGVAAHSRPRSALYRRHPVESDGIRWDLI